MSEANGRVDAVSEANGRVDAVGGDDVRPALRIVRGNPSAEDIAVLVAVLGSVGGGSAHPAPRGPRDLWGTAQDRLRPPMPLAPTAFVNLSIGY